MIAALARPFFGLLPGSELRFDHSSRGAKIGSVGHDRLELRADGWDLFIETDGEGRIEPLEREDTRARLTGEACSHRGKPVFDRRDTRVGPLLGACGAADVANAGENGGKIMRVQREDRWRRRQSRESRHRLLLRHRADIADALR